MGNQPPDSETRAGSSRFLPLAVVGVVLVAVLWIVLQGGEEPVDPVAPIQNPGRGAEVAKPEPVALDPGALPALEGEGPVVVELRYLGGIGEEAVAPRRSGSLEGRLLDEQDEPLPRVNMTIVGGPQDGWSTRTDDTGAYRFPEILPGTHNLRLEVPGRVASIRRVQVLGKARTYRDFRLGPDITFEVVVTDHENAPLAGARLVLDRGIQQAETDESGTVVFAGVPTGHPLLEVFAEGYVPTRHELNLPAGAAGPPRIELPPRRKGGKVRGRVSSWPGPPLPRISAVPQADKLGEDINWEAWYAIEVGADGRFVLAGLPNTRTVVVRASHPEGVSRPRQRPVRADLHSTASVEFVLERGKTRIAGRVLGADSRPLSGAKVVLEASDPMAVLAEFYPGLAEGPVSTTLPVPAALRRTTTTGADGYFDFAVGDRPAGSGKLILTVSAEGYAPARRTVGAALANLVLKLDPARRNVSVTLQARNGQPLPPIRYYLDGLELEQASELQTGRYELRVRRGESEILYEENEVMDGPMNYLVP